MSLKEYSRRSTYGTCDIKRKKQSAYVAVYGLQPVDVEEDYRLGQLCPAPSQSNVEMTCIPHQGSYRSNRGVIVLNGKWYGLVGKIITGGTIESVVLRAAVDDSIEDGTIDYDRLAAHVTRKQNSGKVNKAARLVDDSGADSGFVLQLSKVVPVAGDNSPRTVIISITGSLVERTANHLVIDWYGGNRLTIARSHAEGDWDLLQVGQWFEATISRKLNGEVVRAMLIGTTDEPQGFSEDELTASYISIPAAQLDPVK